MFGYIVVNKDELKVKEFNEYQSYYCGLCQSLKENFGRRGQLSLNYDMTFLALLLTALYEPEEQSSSVKCVAHPMHYHPVVQNPYTAYAAAMNVLLSYYKALDDWEDEHSVKGALYSGILKGHLKELKEQYPRQSQAMEYYMRKISEGEKNGETGIDRMAGYFGKIMEEILLYREDEWEEELRRLGFYLGKYIYILDAFDDLEKDIKNGSYNPFSEVYQASFFDNWIKQLLVMCAQNMAQTMEVLPIVKHESILKNIIYSGIWTKYQAAIKRRSSDTE